MSQNFNTVDFITFCHPGDINRVYAGDWLGDIILSHNYPFDNIRLIKQRCRGVPIHKPNPYNILQHDIIEIVESEDHQDILSEFGLPEQDDKAEHYTHGANAPHYWKWHVINHLIGLKISSAKYIVFSDSDCAIVSQSSDIRSWIDKGIEILTNYPQVLLVGPGDGATMAEAQTREGYRLTQNVSQQLFLCEREKLAYIDFNLPWNWEYLAPGEPMQEYYYMLEGRIWRHLHKFGHYRCILPDDIVRYWHYNKLTNEGMFESNLRKY